MNYSMRAATTVALWLLTTLPILVCTTKKSSVITCHERERQALLKFKQDLLDPSNRLSSWVDESENCCHWAGVVCNNITGHVVELHLGNPYSEFESNAEYETFMNLGGQVNPSLLDLKHLTYLDLSLNSFGGIRIPQFFGSIGSLRYLNLSGAGFEGLIPQQLSNLSNLQYLDIGDNFDLHVENLQWLSGLFMLQHLDLSATNLSKSSDFFQVTNTLPSLKKLHLSRCELDHIPPLVSSNFSSLEVLDLSLNRLLNISAWICNIDTLVSLDLSYNEIQGPIPLGLQNMTSLIYLSLRDNQFNSSIPNWLYSFTHLEFLDLSENDLHGAISEDIGNLTSIITIELPNNELEGEVPKSMGYLCNLRSISLPYNKLTQEISQVLEILSVGCVSYRLESLYLEGCQLYGHLTNKLEPFQNLAYLSLPNNSISGQIPASLGSLMSLRVLDLSSNKLNGTLPEGIGRLTKLEHLHVDHNSLEGIVSEAQFVNLTRLKIINASGNRLTLEVSPDWVPSFQLERMVLSSWNLGPGFPLWLRFQKCLEYLDISHSEINDTIPTWFWDLSYQINYVNLSHNQLHGKVDHLLFYPSIDLSYNHIEGPLPRLSSNIIELHLSSNSFSGSISNFLCYKMNEPKELEVLHFRDNLLSGEIPNCWMNWPYLVSIDLENNNLTGNIPNSIGFLSSLRSLHLSKNNLSGSLPLSLQNCAMLEFLDMDENEFVGKIPNWIGKRLSKLKILSLSSNKFWDQIPAEICDLTSLQILDIAHNNLSGRIPKCFFNFSAMVTPRNLSVGFNYWTNRSTLIERTTMVIKGKEAEYSTILPLVVSIDLSDNNLSGEIPLELTNLLGLISLNLSVNFLRGNIPMDIGKMKSLISIDFHGNQLCGKIPPSISNLSFLNSLNLSYNRLTGRIPLGTQLQSFDAYSYIGNSLCGPPLPNNCSTSGAEPSAKNSVKEDDGKEVDWFYVSMALGFVVGFGVVMCPLLYNKSWRFACFQLLDRMGQKIWEFIHFYRC